ncbi:MAG: hypothetical protein KBI38_06265 [Negativicutes bacterium]|nr:hypothetical protein [Negativicutes bacterium]
MNLKTVTTKTDSKISTDNIVKNEINGVGANENVKRQLFRPVIAKDFTADAGNKNIPFQPQTPISFGSSVQIMLEVLSNLSTATQKSLNSLPPELQKQLMDILQNGFASTNNLEQGLANLLQGQKASIDQTNILSKLLKILSNIAAQNQVEGNAVTAEDNLLSPQLKTLLSNLKQIDNQDGKFFNAVNISKLATKLLENNKEVPNVLKQNFSMGENNLAENELAKKLPPDLKAVLKALVSPSNEKNFVQTQQSGVVLAEEQSLSFTAKETVSQPIFKEVEQNSLKNNTVLSESTEPELVVPTKNEAGNDVKQQQSANSKNSNDATLLTDNKDNVETNQLFSDKSNKELPPEKNIFKLTPEQEKAIKQPGQTVGEPTQNENISLSKNFGFVLDPKELTNVLKNLAQQLLTTKTISPEQEVALKQFLNNKAQLKPEEVEQFNKLLKLCEDFTLLTDNKDNVETNQLFSDKSNKGLPPEKNIFKLTPEQEGAIKQPGQTVGEPTQNENISLSKNFGFVLDPKELTNVLKNLAQQLLTTKTISPEQEVALKQFLNNKAQLKPEEVEQFNKLLKLCEDFTPLSIKQAAVKNKAEDLPKLWIMAQLSDLAEVADLPAEQLKAAAKSLHDFSTILRSALQNENEVGNNQKSMSFMLPLYMGENEQNYPAYFHIYHEKENGKNPYANQEYETWLRICLLTENIGAVEIVFRLYENDKLNLRIALAEDEFVKDFNENFSQVQTALTEMPFNLTEVKVFKISER